MRADWRGHQCWRLDWGARTAEPTHLSSSDSDFDDEEPRKIYVHIKPASARAPPCSPKAAAAQLKATAGSLILPPGPGVRRGEMPCVGQGVLAECPPDLMPPLCPQGTMKRHSSREWSVEGSSV